MESLVLIANVKEFQVKLFETEAGQLIKAS